MTALPRTFKFWWNVSFAALEVGIFVWNLVIGNPLWVPLLAVAAFCWFTFLAVVEVRRGHRKAARDRDDSSLGSVEITSFAFGGPVSTGEATGTDSGLTETTADVPILAFKRCKLRWAPGGRFWLQSQYNQQAIELDADAQCVPNFYVSGFGMKPEPHDAPSVKCACGFYAVGDSEHSSGYGSVLLDVELSGRVIIHERGYRAQHQRVLRARVAGCHYCGQTPTTFLVQYRQPKQLANLGTSTTVATTTNYGIYMPGQISGPDEALALCEAHITDDITVPIEVVAARLNVPFECGVSESVR